MPTDSTTELDPLAGLSSSPRRADGVAAVASRTLVPPPRRRWVTRLLLPGAILLATGGLLAVAARDSLLAATPVEFVRVVAKSVEVGDEAAGGVATTGDAGTGAAVAQAPGWVEPDPYPLYVSALTPGVVKEVLVLEGQPVKEKQVVARMVSTDAELALRRAQAEVDRRKAQLAAAETEWKNPVARERMVAVAAAMRGEAQAEVHAADAMIAQQKAVLAEVQAAFDRIKGLGEGAASALDIDQAKFRLEAQRAVVESATRQRAVADAKVTRARAEEDAARRDLELRITERKELDTAAAELADATAALEEAQLRLDRMEITSPFDGVVMTRISAPGSRLMIDGGDPDAGHVVHLYDPKQLQVRADVPLGDASKVGVGQRAQIVVDVLPDKTFTGKVSRVVHQADIGKNTLQVKVAIEDPSPQLKPEMLARVRFFAMAREPASGSAQPNTASVRRTQLRVFVPASVIASAGAPDVGAEATVWLVDVSGNKARRQAIRLGASEIDGWREVASGLNPGDAVILEPPANLREGDRIKPIEHDGPQHTATKSTSKKPAEDPHAKHKQ